MKTEMTVTLDDVVSAMVVLQTWLREATDVDADDVLHVQRIYDALAYANRIVIE